MSFANNEYRKKKNLARSTLRARSATSFEARRTLRLRWKRARFIFETAPKRRKGGVCAGDIANGGGRATSSRAQGRSPRGDRIDGRGDCPNRSRRRCGTGHRGGADQTEDKTLEEIRIGDLSHVALFGNIQISTQAVQVLCEKEIPLTYFSMGGWFYGITRGHELTNVFTRIEQFRLARDPAVCLRLARAWFSERFEIIARY